jgi:hemerythrin superfamily protein
LPSLHFPILKETPEHVFRLGLEQDELKSIMQDILEMDLNNDWEVRTIGAPKNV